MGLYYITHTAFICFYYTQTVLGAMFIWRKFNEWQASLIVWQIAGYSPLPICTAPICHPGCQTRSEMSISTPSKTHFARRTACWYRNEAGKTMKRGYLLSGLGWYGAYLYCQYEIQLKQILHVTLCCNLVHKHTYLMYISDDWDTQKTDGSCSRLMISSQRFHKNYRLCEDLLLFFLSYDIHWIIILPISHMYRVSD